MSPRAQVYFLGLFFILAGLGLISYKHINYGLPIAPGEYQTVWTIEAKVEFDAVGGPVTASLALPKSQSNIQIVDEVFSSSGFGFTTETSDGNERAVWTKREASGEQSLYYKLDLYQTSTRSPRLQEHGPLVVPNNAEWAGSKMAAVRNSAQAIVYSSWQESSTTRSFVTQLIKKFNDPENGDGKIIRANVTTKNSVKQVLDMLAFADVAAHIVRGIYLENDRRRILPTSLIEFYDGKYWDIVNPVTGERGLPEDFLIWQQGDKSLLDVTGGKNSRVRFSSISNDIPAKNVALQQLNSEEASLASFSIYSLPIEQQSVFKFILLVPIGTLVVIILRVLIGVTTAGTFMPVLLAIAFIQTTLLTGVLIFLLILLVGLWVRTYLSRLDLLLVSRIAAVVVVVVSMMVAISIFSYKLGYEQALTVTFFPMIIIAWTIEHMSILWEDDGPLEVLKQTAGSLFAAVLCYLVMTNRFMGHWTFNFPEVLLITLGLIIILGHYTGYRLSELVRFKPMGDP